MRDILPRKIAIPTVPGENSRDCVHHSYLSVQEIMLCEKTILVEEVLLCKNTSSGSTIEAVEGLRSECMHLEGKGSAL